MGFGGWKCALSSGHAMMTDMMTLRAPASGCSRSAVAWVTVALWALAAGLAASTARARAKRNLRVMGASGTEEGARQRVPECFAAA